MNDNEIIQQIRQGNTTKLLKQLYLEYPKVKAMMLQSGGTASDTKEIFNDSLILLIEKVENPEFKLTSKLTTYLYGINRFLWKNHLRKSQKSVELEWSDTLILTEQDLGYNNEKEEKLKVLETVLGQISERCQKLFKQFYFLKKSMQEIAKSMNFSSVNSAKTQKYKCLERAIKLAKSNFKTQAL